MKNTKDYILRLKEVLYQTGRLTELDIDYVYDLTELYSTQPSDLAELNDKYQEVKAENKFMKYMNLFIAIILIIRLITNS